MSITVSEFDVAEVPATLDELPELILRYLREHAFEIFASLFSDAVEWLKQVAKKLIHATEEQIGRALKEHFHEPLERVASLGREILSLDEAGVARVLLGTGASGQDVAKLLIDNGFAKAAVEAAMGLMLPGQHVDYSYAHIDRDAQGHIDVSARVHLDEGGMGHVNIGGKGHVNKGGKGHVNEGGKGHVNIGGKGHIDKQIRFGIGSKHVNTAVIPHVDERAIPHIDQKAIPHIDTRAVPHADTPAIPHIDVKATPHADTPAIPHVNSPGHVDVGQDG